MMEQSFQLKFQGTQLSFLCLCLFCIQNNFLLIMQALKRITLESNNIGDDGAKYLAFALRNNTVTLIHIRKFDYAISHLLYVQTVTKLNLSRNIICIDGGQYLLNELQNNIVSLTTFFFISTFSDVQTLTDLTLSNNRSGYCYAVEICLKIKNNPVMF